MQRRSTLSTTTLTVTVTALALAICSAGPAAAQARPLGAPPPAFPGEVLALAQTPHLWVADPQGVAHLAGDPTALASHPVDWAARREVTRDELGALPRGEPWLSLPMVRSGEAIYLPQRASDGEAPTLVHVASVSDLALLGVTAENYGRLVLERADWEQRYGYDITRLRLDGDLSLDPPPPVATEVPPPTTTRDDTNPD